MQDDAVRAYLLVVEDNSADVFLINEAIISGKIDATLHFERDGEGAIQFLQRIENDSSQACPNLLLIDLNLPKRAGSEVLQYARSTHRFRKTPVLIVTSSNSVRDRDEMAHLGANAYFRKPSSYTQFMQLGGIIRELLEARTTDA